MKGSKDPSEPIKDGLVQTFYDNGVLASETEFKNGLKHGLCKTYLRNGQLRAVGNYNRDNRGEGGSRFKSGNSSYRGDFKRKTFGDRGDSGFKKSFGGNRGFNDRSYEKKEMFDTVCDECGRECKVPFRPSNDKPIF